MKYKAKALRDEKKSMTTQRLEFNFHPIVTFIILPVRTLRYPGEEIPPTMFPWSYRE
jgi:Na+/H+ antiporter NhaA